MSYGDTAELEHREWLNYPCSVAQLQESANVVMRKINSSLSLAQ